MKSEGLFRRIVLSWDWILALIVVIAASYSIPQGANIGYAKELYSTGISVLSIVFSLFLTSLAILITAGDNEFVRFLEEDGSYTRIVSTFKITFLLLSLSLVSAIVLHAISLRVYEVEPQALVSRSQLLLFSFVGMYSLLATVQSSLDMLKYAELRARFLNITSRRKEE